MAEDVKKEIPLRSQKAFPEKSMRIEKMKKWIYDQLLFIVTIVFILGACAGLYGGKVLYESKLGEAVKIGGAVLENKVYDVKLRP